MKIDTTTLQKIAHLARLEVKPEEEGALVQSLESVLSWMEQLNELDTTDIQPLTHISAEINVMRDDITGTHLPRLQALRNAPAHDEVHFKVPKVIE
jgi:aspartyl-tRNA(Asn)/glutamyl-tRNA(Gln) amidotransferase subunit C